MFIIDKCETHYNKKYLKIVKIGLLKIKLML